MEGGGGSVVVASITGRFINRFKNESYNYNILTDNLDKDWILVVIHNTQLRDHMQAFLFPPFPSYGQIFKLFLT